MNQKKFIVSTVAFACGLCLFCCDGQVQSNAQAPREAVPASQAAALAQAPGEAVPASQAAAPAQTQSEAGGVAIEFSREAGTGQGVQTENAKQQAEEFVNSKGWELDSDTDGFWAVIAEASLPCGPDSPSFQQCREQAFEEALLNAKTKLAEFLRVEVSSILESSLSEITRSGDASNPTNPAAAQQVDSTLLGKAKTLLNFEVDKLMAARGIKAGTPEAKEAMEEITSEVIQQKDFESALFLQARAELSGLQAYKTFETSLKGKKGTIAVVAIHSPKSAQLHQALLGKGDPPMSDAKESIRKWAQTEGPKVLLYTHGAQPRANEKGEVVLVGFGQSVAQSDSDLSREIAGEKATIAAQGALRRFMGELITVSKSSEQSSSLKDYANSTDVFKSNSAVQKESNAIGGKLGMSGAKEVYSWNAVHPASGKTVIGSVYVFSVSQARKANKMFFDFQKAGGAAGGAGSFGVAPPPEVPAASKPKKVPTGKDSSGDGAEGEAP